MRHFFTQFYSGRDAKIWSPATKCREALYRRRNSTGGEDGGLQPSTSKAVGGGFLGCLQGLRQTQTHPLGPPNGWQMTPKQPLQGHSTDPLPAIGGSWCMVSCFGHGWHLTGANRSRRETPRACFEHLSVSLQASGGASRAPKTERTLLKRFRVVQPLGLQQPEPTSFNNLILTYLSGLLTRYNLPN